MTCTFLKWRCGLKVSAGRSGTDYLAPGGASCSPDLQGIALLTARSMSISSLEQVLADKLGERDAKHFSSVHLQNLLDKEHTDEGALQDASREAAVPSCDACCIS